MSAAYLLPIFSIASAIAGALTQTLIAYLINRSQDPLNGAPSERVVQQLKTHTIFSSLYKYTGQVQALEFGDDARTALVQDMLITYIRIFVKEMEVFVTTNVDNDIKTIKFNFIHFFGVIKLKWMDSSDEKLSSYICEDWFKTLEKHMLAVVNIFLENQKKVSQYAFLCSILDLCYIFFDFFIENAKFCFQKVNGICNGIVYKGIRTRFIQEESGVETLFQNCQRILERCDFYIPSSIWFVRAEERHILFATDSFCETIQVSIEDIFATQLISKKHNAERIIQSCFREKVSFSNLFTSGQNDLEQWNLALIPIYKETFCIYCCIIVKDLHFKTLRFYETLMQKLLSKEGALFTFEDNEFVSIVSGISPNEEDFNEAKANILQSPNQGNREQCMWLNVNGKLLVLFT
jgi:hypothetical protein